MAFGKAKSTTRPDIQAARDAITSRGQIGINKAVDDVETIVAPDERVVAMTVANQDGVAICVLTDRRLVVITHHLGKQAQREVPLRQVSAVAYNRSAGLVSAGSLVLSTAGGDVVVAGIAGGHESDRFLALVRSQLEAVRASNLQPASAPPDIVGQIGQLAALRDSGALSEQEFAAKKAELLARM